MQTLRLPSRSRAAARPHLTPLPLGVMCHDHSYTASRRRLRENQNESEARCTTLRSKFTRARVITSTLGCTCVVGCIRVLQLSGPGMEQANSKLKELAARLFSRPPQTLPTRPSTRERGRENQPNREPAFPSRRPSTVNIYRAGGGMHSSTSSGACWPAHAMC